MPPVYDVNVVLFPGLSPEAIPCVKNAEMTDDFAFCTRKLSLSKPKRFVVTWSSLVLHVYVNV